jgi:hypothetical protein
MTSKPSPEAASAAGAAGSESSPNSASSADHDHGYKLLFAHAEMVRDLLTGFVDEPWVKELQFDTLQRVSASYVSDDLRDREGDIVWRVQLRGRWLGEKTEGPALAAGAAHRSVQRPAALARRHRGGRFDRAAAGAAGPVHAPPGVPAAGRGRC